DLGVRFGDGLVPDAVLDGRHRALVGADAGRAGVRTGPTEAGPGFAGGEKPGEDADGQDPEPLHDVRLVLCVRVEMPSWRDSFGHRSIPALRSRGDGGFGET